MRVQLHTFTWGYSVFSTPSVEKTVLSPLNGLGTLAENYLTIYGRIYFWILKVILDSLDSVNDHRIASRSFRPDARH